RQLDRSRRIQRGRRRRGDDGDDGDDRPRDHDATAGDRDAAPGRHPTAGRHHTAGGPPTAGDGPGPTAGDRSGTTARRHPGTAPGRHPGVHGVSLLDAWALDSAPTEADPDPQATAERLLEDVGGPDIGGTVVSVRGPGGTGKTALLVELGSLWSDAGL